MCWSILISWQSQFFLVIRDCHWMYLDKIRSFLMFFLSVIFHFRRSSAFVVSELLVILLWTPYYQLSVEDSRLPTIRGLQTTSPLWLQGVLFDFVNKFLVGHILWLSLVQLCPSLSVGHSDCCGFNFWYCIWTGSTVPLHKKKSYNRNWLSD